MRYLIPAVIALATLSCDQKDQSVSVGTEWSKKENEQTEQRLKDREGKSVHVDSIKYIHDREDCPELGPEPKPKTEESKAKKYLLAKTPKPHLVGKMTIKNGRFVDDKGFFHHCSFCSRCIP